MFKRIRPMVIKEFRQIRRDKRTLFILLAFPAFLILLHGYALNFDVKHIATAIFDQDRTSESREFVRSFSNSEYFDIVANPGDYREAEELITDGRAKVVVVIPRDFAHAIAGGNDASVQLLIDGSNANSATTVIGYMNIIIQRYSVEIAKQVMARHGREFVVPLDVRPKVWYNPELKSAKFFVPGLFGFILMLSGVISTSLSVVREKERGTLEQLEVSRLHTYEIIIGKTIPYLIISLLASALILVVGFFFFDISVRGSFFWLFVGIFIFIVGALGQGLLISAIAPNQQVAFLMSVFSSLLPTFLLSGFVFPIENMPWFLRVASHAIPAQFFLVVVRSIILKGVGPEIFWKQLAFLVLFASIILTVSSMRLMKRNN